MNTPIWNDEDMIDPRNFVKQFPDMEGFKIWAHKGILADVREAIVVFEYYEMYEHCAALQEVIDEKVDVMLSGFGFTD